MRHVRSNEVHLRWRHESSTLRYRPHRLPSAQVAKSRPWWVVAIIEVASAVARGTAAGATRAPIDTAGAHMRFDAGIVADRRGYCLLTVPQPQLGDFSPDLA